MSQVLGRDINLYVEKVNDSGVFKFSSCATNLSMEVTCEEILITSADSGIEDEYQGGATNCSVSMEGVITIDELSKFMYEDWRASVGKKKKIRIDFTDSYGDRLRYEMTILVTSVSAQGDAADFGSFSISGKRSGAEIISKGYDHILEDSLHDPILDLNGDLIRVP